MDALITCRQLAQKLGIGLQTLYNWRNNGKGPRYVRLGRYVRYRQSDIEEWLESRITDTADTFSPTPPGGSPGSS